MSHSSVEEGTGKISDWISGVKYFKLLHLFMNFYCVKSTFFFEKAIFDKVLKLVERAIKPLQHQKTLKSFNKILEQC